MFLREFESILKKCKPRNLHILGDFNINLHRLEGETAKSFEELILSNGLFPLISIPTHVKPGCKPSCIDNIFTTNISSVLSSGTIVFGTSHHRSIFQLTDRYYEDIEKVATVQYYDFSNSKTEKFLESIEEVFGIYDQANLQQFLSIYNEKVDEIFKLKSPKISKRNRKCNPWITDALIISIEKKETLYNDWDDTRNKISPEGDRNLHKKYSDYRRCLKHTITAAKNKYHGKKFQQNVGNFKKTWEVINELRGKHKSTIRSQFIIDNEKITNRRVIANEFNKYFVSLASKMNEPSAIGIEMSPITNFTEFLKSSNQSSIFLEDCTINEIEEIINSLENNKASDIPINLIKKSAFIIAPILARTFNDCMKEGVFPDDLKIGRITPIYKKGAAESIENYRPVSTLPIFGKIFEKVIYERLYSFFVSQNIMNPQQFGFRKGHSTSHALNFAIDHIEKAISQKSHVLAIFIDFSKAFDTIDHEILLHKLWHYGIRGSAHKLIKSYLLNRIQYTHILNEKSEKANVVYGVPQGSVLGPLLFLIYINDLIKCSQLSCFVLFADDTNIFVTGKNYNEAARNANSILDAVCKYTQANKLHINKEKTCFMHFLPKGLKMDNTADKIPLSLNGNEIEEVSETKFLGITIDNQLSWESHLNILHKKLKCCTGQLNRIIDLIPKELHKSLYHTLYESHLSYGITVWGGVPFKKLKPLFIAQKLCLRIIFGDRKAYLEKFQTSARARPYLQQKLGQDFYQKEHSKPLFNNNQILTVHNLHKYQTLLSTFKILKLRTPIAVHNCFKISNRKDYLLHMPINASVNFIYDATSLWLTLLSCPESAIIKDFTVGVGRVKSKVRELILCRQKMGDENDWCENTNFNLR